MSNGFHIKEVIILKNENWSNDVLKILKQGETYCLCDGSVPLDFFGKNIEVSAIVGKNGSGKYCLNNKHKTLLIENDINLIFNVKKYTK